MKRKSAPPLIFFNASVILSGLHSPTGGSGKLLTFAKQNRIRGIMSEIILDETLRHTEKVELAKKTVKKFLFTIFTQVYPAPKNQLVQKFTKIVIDQGDAHVLASCRQSNADYLVTLDKKHLLVLQNKIKGLKIVSPKELLELLRLK